MIQLAQRTGGDSLRMMALLRAAAVMRQAQLDPAPLFEELQMLESPQLRWTDRAMLVKLLADCDAPKELSAFIRDRVPAKPASGA